MRLTTKIEFGTSDFIIMFCYLLCSIDCRSKGGTRTRTFIFGTGLQYPQPIIIVIIIKMLLSLLLLLLSLFFLSEGGALGLALDAAEHAGPWMSAGDKLLHDAGRGGLLHRQPQNSKHDDHNNFVGPQNSKIARSCVIGWPRPNLTILISNSPTPTASETSS